MQSTSGMNLNETRLEHEEVSKDVIEALSPINKEITESYIQVISDLDKSDLALVIKKQFSHWVDEHWSLLPKDRNAIKPWNNDYAYTVIVQAALHHLYPEEDIIVDSYYGPKTKELMLRFFDDYSVVHHANDTWWAWPLAFKKLYEVFSWEAPWTLSDEEAWTLASDITEPVSEQSENTDESDELPYSLVESPLLQSIVTKFEDFDLDDYPYRKKIRKVWQYRNRDTGYFNYGIAEWVNIKQDPNWIIITRGTFNNGRLVKWNTSWPFSNFSTKSPDWWYAFSANEQWRKQLEWITINDSWDLIRSTPDAWDSLTDTSLEDWESPLE